MRKWEKELRRKAKSGTTKSQAARELGISRQRVQQVAEECKIDFTRHTVSLVTLTCPRCKRERTLIRYEAGRRKSDVCLRCLRLGKQL